MNVTSTTQTQYTQTTNKAHRAEKNTDTEYKQNEASVAQVVDSQSSQNKSPSVIKNFLNDLYSNESTSFKSSVIKDTIENKVNTYAQLMMDERGTATESELETSKLLNEYKKELLQEYKTSIENSTDNVMSAEQEAMIKVLMEENVKETSSLEKLLATTSGTNATQETKATGKMAEMQEKYKDVYTPIPDTYSKADEDLQTQKVYEAHPTFPQPGEFLALVDAALQGEPIKWGQKLTKEEKEIQKQDYEQAYQKAYAVFGGQEAYMEMARDVQQIKSKYPVNHWGKDERIHNATELARFTNAATYEGLEQGKSIEEAEIYASHLRFSFMDTSYSHMNFLETLVKAGRADQSALDLFLSEGQEESRDRTNEVDFSSPINTIMDLREYGIEGNWEYYEIKENQADMIAEINKKIGQFNFMLSNESRIEEAYMKLDGDYHDLGNNAGYKRMINEKYMPMMEEGLNVFKKYTIYDS